MSTRNLTIDPLESRYLLTSRVFVENLAAIEGAPINRVFQLGDLNGDGRVDLVAGTSFTSLGWFENVGKETFQYRKEILSAGFVQSHQIVDFDDDGDLDIIGDGDGHLYWFENANGKAEFTAHVIAELGFNVYEGLRQPISPTSVVYEDFDRDGDRDVLAVVSDGLGPYETRFYESQGGQFVEHARIDLVNACVAVLLASDFDGDNDVDFIHGHTGLGALKLRLFENEGGTDFADPVDIGSHAYESTPRLADLDGDGDDDLITHFATWQNEFKGIDWFENVEGVFRDSQPVLRDNSVRQVEPIDLDLDGDVDVVFLGRRIGWLENVDNSNVFSDPDLFGRFVNIPAIVSDYDVDGDQDIFSLFSRTTGRWYENRLAGDANNDNVVDFKDFLALSNSFGKAGSAKWEEGDFNFDESVDFEDFLILEANFRG